jgi:hypothetical protein
MSREPCIGRLSSSGSARNLLRRNNTNSCYLRKPSRCFHQYNSSQCRCRLGARGCPRSAGSQTPCYTATLADLGSRARDGQAQDFHRSHGGAGLLLRSTKPLATGFERKHQSALRQYFPRGTDLSGYSQAQLDQVALRLNERPRKTLGFETPAHRLQASVASTV